MRATASVKIFAVAWLTLNLWACDTASELPFGGSPAPVSAIADLKLLCRGTTFRITEDITVGGVVIADDNYGEFHKTSIIQDSSGGIAVLIDHTMLAKEFPFGTTVSIHCNGLALGRNGDKIQLGAVPTGEYSVDRIPRSDVGRYIRITGPASAPSVTLLTLDEVSAQHIDRYVRFDDIYFVTTGPWCEVEEETLRPEVCEREIADAGGNTFTVRIPGTCVYATEPIPSGTGSISGIIDYFNGKYSLCITNRDIDFTASATHPTAYPSVGGCSFRLPTK